MNEVSNKRAVYVGLFVFVGLAFLIAGILMIGNLHETFKRKIKVVALFDDVGGLQTGNNIWFSGVKIGTVSKLTFKEGSLVEVIMRIEVQAQQYIRKNSNVKLSTDGLIGNKILVIYGGTPKSSEIQEGDTLGVEKTFTSDDMINTLQENNKNILAITDDFKIVSKKISEGDGTVGKLLNDDAIYDNINAATISLQSAAKKTEQLLGSLNTFSESLNKKGTLVNQIVTDTTVFNSIKIAASQLQDITDSATALLGNLNEASRNPNSPIGVLLHDEKSGQHLKQTIINLEGSSKKLEEDLEAAQHTFLLRHYFRKKAKEEKQDSSVVK